MLESCYSEAGKQPTSRISLLYYFLKAHGKKKKETKQKKKRKKIRYSWSFGIDVEGR